MRRSVFSLSAEADIPIHHDAKIEYWNQAEFESWLEEKEFSKDFIQSLREFAKKYKLNYVIQELSILYEEDVPSGEEWTRFISAMRTLMEEHLAQGITKHALKTFLCFRDESGAAVLDEKTLKKLAYVFGKEIGKEMSASNWAANGMPSNETMSSLGKGAIDSIMKSPDFKALVSGKAFLSKRVETTVKSTGPAQAVGESVEEVFQEVRVRLRVRDRSRLRWIPHTQPAIRTDIFEFKLFGKDIDHTTAHNLLIKRWRRKLFSWDFPKEAAALPPLHGSFC